MTYTTACPYFPEEEIPKILDKIKDVLQNKEMLTMGRHVEEFEKKFSNYIGTKYGIATNSCTSALETTLRSINVIGKEVIVPTQTFMATGASVINAGGKVVFADINPKNYNISLKSIKEKITDKTKAIIVVHFAGLITDEIFEIKELCEDKDIYLIEDCAHAHGASIDGIKAGNIGDVGCFSFYATKIMTTGEGGMMTTNNDELYEKMSSIRNRGLNIKSNEEIYINFGSNYRMTEICAILGLSQLKYLDKFVKHRNKIAKIYDETFEELEQKNLVEVIRYPANTIHSYWRYVLKLNENIDRKYFQNTLFKKGIKIDWPYEPPLHLQPAFKKIYGNYNGLLPVAEREMKKHVCIPIHIKISDNDAIYISETIKKVLLNR
jgi:perosamine synthetase